MKIQQPMTRELKDYRPQHDEDCRSRHCVVCSREGLTASHTGYINGHMQQLGECTCGLNALLAVPARERRQEEGDQASRDDGDRERGEMTKEAFIQRWMQWHDGRDFVADLDALLTAVRASYRTTEGGIGDG